MILFMSNGANEHNMWIAVKYLIYIRVATEIAPPP